jgi:hypothetical protein
VLLHERDELFDIFEFFVHDDLRFLKLFGPGVVRSCIWIGLFCSLGGASK